MVRVASRQGSLPGADVTRMARRDRETSGHATAHVRAWIHDRKIFGPVPPWEGRAGLRGACWPDRISLLDVQNSPRSSGCPRVRACCACTLPPRGGFHTRTEPAGRRFLDPCNGCKVVTSSMVCASSTNDALHKVSPSVSLSVHVISFQLIAAAQLRLDRC